MARLQAVYALTVHTSQGSTFQNAFIDLADIRKAEFARPREMQQLLYVAVTRASRAVILLGAPVLSPARTAVLACPDVVMYSRQVSV